MCPAPVGVALNPWAWLLDPDPCASGGYRQKTTAVIDAVTLRKWVARGDGTSCLDSSADL